MSKTARFVISLLVAFGCGAVALFFGRINTDDLFYPPPDESFNVPFVVTVVFAIAGVLAFAYAISILREP